MRLFMLAPSDIEKDRKEKDEFLQSHAQELS